MMDLGQTVKKASAERMADFYQACQMTKDLKEEGVIVMTTCVVRHWGASWFAWDDKTWPDGPQGFGKTETEAIESLKEQLDEQS
jgi:hypothetical protein